MKVKSSQTFMKLPPTIQYPMDLRNVHNPIAQCYLRIHGIFSIIWILSCPHFLGDLWMRYGSWYDEAGKICLNCGRQLKTGFIMHVGGGTHQKIIEVLNNKFETYNGTRSHNCPCCQCRFTSDEKQVMKPRINISKQKTYWTSSLLPSSRIIIKLVKSNSIRPPTAWE